VITEIIAIVALCIIAVSTAVIGSSLVLWRKRGYELPCDDDTAKPECSIFPKRKQGSKATGVTQDDEWMVEQEKLEELRKLDPSYNQGE